MYIYKYMGLPPSGTPSCILTTRQYYLFSFKTQVYEQTMIMQTTISPPSSSSSSIFSHESSMTYPSTVDQIRETEYPHLEKQIYLDHAGMTVYSKSLLDNTNKLLLGNLFGNPHSQSFSSQNSSDLITTTRLKVLELFQADPLVYDVAFTLNSTHSIKILSTIFKDHFNEFDYIYNINSHTSVVGVRTLAQDFQTFDTLQDLNINDQKITLIAWPGQSNFNGERFPIQDWNVRFKSYNNTYTLLDAASLSSTSPPNLSNSDESPDFISVSFYKMFGLPDLGGLIFKKDTANDIFKSKKYFGGGTVDALSATSNFSALKARLTSMIEEGTLPIHSIIQLSEAIRTNEIIYGSFDNISKYTSILTKYAYDQLSALRFDNGNSMVKIHNNNAKEQNGPIISFSLKLINGEHAGYHNFEKFTTLQNVSLRTGTLCNIGAIQKYINRQDSQIRQDYLEGHKCGDHMDVIDGEPTGVVRISFGAMTKYSEIDFLIDTIKDFLTDDIEEHEQERSVVAIDEMVVYPIKSCLGYSVPKETPWEITDCGLLFDREFLLINLLDGNPIALKNYKKMCFLKPIIKKDEREIDIYNTLTNEFITANIDLDKYDRKYLKEVSNGKKSFIAIMNTEYTDFFKKLLDIPCTLAKSSNTSENLQNKSSFLLVNATSLASLGFSNNDLIKRFRSNLIISADQNDSFIEDSWNGIYITGANRSENAASPVVLNKIDNCNRCHMITITEDGQVDSSLFLKLSKTRKVKGKVYFGINLNLEQLGCGLLNVGDKVVGFV